MTDEAGKDTRTETEGAREAKARRGRMGDGIRQGIGVLSAFKDALEETIQEARDRGDLSTDRAKEVMKDALVKAQAAAEGAKDRLDFAHQTDLEALEAAVASLRSRVAELEESVFGAVRDPMGPDDSATYAAPEGEGARGTGEGDQGRESASEG
jgi:polyhydroxyalkanoate synthesis regulator phasin